MIAKTFNLDTDYYVKAKEVEEIEKRHLKIKLAAQKAMQEAIDKNGDTDGEGESGGAFGSGQNFEGSGKILRGNS